jgi:glycoprotein endo-alpha-1,2-mannosidase
MISRRITIKQTRTLIILLLIVSLITYITIHYHLPIQFMHQQQEMIHRQVVVTEQPEVMNETILHRELPSKVHIFYYAWYRNVEHDGKYNHWNHAILPHWTQEINNRFKDIGKECDVNKDEIGSNYYPKLGLYSSLDYETMKHHLLEIRQECNVNVLIISYWANRGDENIDKDHAQKEDEYINSLMKLSEKLGMYIIFHLEPFKGRNAQNTFEVIKYLIDTYGSSPAFYRVKRSDLLSGSNDQNSVPLFYIYDSYLTPGHEWNSVISNKIHGTQYDSIIIGLYTDRNSERLITQSGFDGFYTYFGAVGFTYGSTPSNWPSMANYASENNKIFIPSVAPGYIDEKIRPWNSQNTKSRQHGKYYDDMFKKAIDTKVPIITVTSYNEWHEGTQIEPAIPMKYTSRDGKSVAYKDYSPEEPDYYLKRTAYWVNKIKS